MTSVIKLNHFVYAANQVYAAPVSYCLVADSQGLGVTPQPLAAYATSPSVRRENRRTWQVFKDSLIGTIGQQKFDWICQRYRSHINFTYLARSGTPLLPKHVELFSIGSSQVLSRDIKRGSSVKLKTMMRAQLKERIEIVQPFPIVGSYNDPVNIFGSPGTAAAYIFHDKLLMDKEKQLLFSDVERLSFPAWLERFCKVTINRELIEGQVIPVPGQDGRIDYCKIHRKIARDGLVAYALKPIAKDTTLKPMIIFRPTQWAFSNEDAFEAYLNDAQPSVGEMGWSATKELFEMLMKDRHFRRNNERISVSGYSLGGTHVQRFLEAHYEHVASAIFYNDPSVDKETAERFAEKVNLMPRRTEEPLNIQIFRTNNDFCHYVGEKHVGWGVYHPDVNIQLLEIDPESNEITAFHSHRIFDNTRFPYQIKPHENTEELFNHLDNTKRGDTVLYYEKMRSLTSRVAFFSLTLFSKLVKLFSNLLGVKILRSSRDLS
jgi:hypothetical protein